MCAPGASDVSIQLRPAGGQHGTGRIRRSGLTLLPARQVAPPLIAECKAHLECKLEAVTRRGAEVVIFGTIVAASIDQDCAGSSLADQYFRLRPVFFLEEGVYGSIDAAKRIGTASPTEQSLTVVELYEPPDYRDVEAHVAFLRSLRDSGVLLMAGPYDGWREEPDRSRPTGAAQEAYLRLHPKSAVQAITTQVVLPSGAEASAWAKVQRACSS